MTSEEIIELALQCGIWIPLASGPEREQTIDNLRRFAALVATAERDALRAAVQHEADCVEACKSEIERLRAENAGLVDDMNLLRDNNASLRARIEEMEKQEPVRLITAVAYRWRYRGAVMWQYGELTEEAVRAAKEHNHEVQSLYALPGAQNVPTALLVAVANLVA